MPKLNFFNLDVFRYNFDDQDFLDETGKMNVYRAYIISFVSLFFGIALLILDWIRYKNGMLADAYPNSFFLRLSLIFHIILICTGIPALFLYKHQDKIKTGQFPALDNLLLSVIFIAGFALVTLGILGIADRGSIMGFAAFIIIVNHFFSINGPRRLAISIFCFVALVIGVFLLKEDPTHRYVYILEGAGIMIPSFLIANIQTQLRYENFNINRQLEAQNQLIQENNRSLIIKSLQGQMNPHFIFNTLNSIQHFMLRRDLKPSMNYLSQFAKLIRSIFKYSSQNFITLEDEIEFLTLYLNLETLRFENKIKVDFKVESNLKHTAHEIYLPPLLIQPLIENTFKHGLMHLEENGKLDIHFYKENNHFNCIIEDNGVGRKAATKYKNWLHNHTTIEDDNSALKIIYQRLKVFNDIVPTGITSLNELRIDDLIDDTGQPYGTRVHLVICLKTQDEIYRKQQQKKINLIQKV